MYPYLNSSLCVSTIIGIFQMLSQVLKDMSYSRPFIADRLLIFNHKVGDQNLTSPMIDKLER
jgi:hypothetical protein